MYDSTSNGEFVELTNIGGTPINLTGWSFDDSSRAPNSLMLTPFGTVAPGESVIITDRPEATFRSDWGLGPAVKIIGGSLEALQRGDEINVYDSSLTLVDRLTYNDQTIAGSIRTQNKSGWGCAEALGTNNILKWTLSSASPVDSQGSFAAPTGGAIGSPGTFVSVPCPNAPVISSLIPARKTAVATLPTVSVTFAAGVTGVVAGNLTVNGSAATSLSGSGAGPYIFSGFTAPATGSATVTLAAGAIVSQVGSVPFAGDSWTVSVGITVVINEINYHPNEAIYPAQETEFIELYNAGPNSVNLSGWQFNQGITYTIPNGTNLASGAYLVLATDAPALQAATGYAGALQWTTGGSGGLSNSGERLTIVDTSLNVIDTVEYADSGAWPSAADGDGPSLELRNPGYPNDFGAAWGASVPNNGTPGAQNSVYQASLGPIIFGTAHTPIIPAANQSVTVTATVVDDSPTPTVTLYYRQDQDPTIAYSSVAMLDDGAHGDGAVGDKVYGATMPGLSEGSRMDFTIRADDGSNVSAAPSGHNTLTAGQYPNQTYLCKFSSVALPADFPSYHIITTQRIRNLQENHTETDYDATFVHCDTFGNCKNWYNATERYRGASSLNAHPHSFRVNVPNSPNFDSELGFQTTKINLLSQSMHKQYLGMQFFREAFGGQIPTPRTQFVRFLTNPISHGGAGNLVYHNVEVLDGDFVESQNGDVTPLRWPDRCSTSLAACGTPADCSGVQSCVTTDDGNLYRGRHDGSRLYYEGTDPNAYRTDASGQNGYQKYTNEGEDDWTDLMALTFALDPSTTPDASYENAVNAVIDEDEWAKWFAIHMLLVNQEGGIYRDTGDDYFMYMQRSTSPGGYNCKMLPWDMDSTFGGADDNYNIETIWRTTVQNPQRFLRSNAYAGRFVKAICDLMSNEFLQATMDAKIDALPAAIANATRKTQLKNWVAARRISVQNEIKSQLTIANLPASPYTNANPVINLNGLLNQCGTRYVKVNGQDADGFSVYLASWNKSITLKPGLNHITVQNLDHTNTEVSRVDATVFYDPPPTLPGLRLTVPTRMVDSKTLTLRADILDAAGNIEWRTCTQTGIVSATRISDGSPVPTSITVFETLGGGAGGGGPFADELRFYNGVASVSITLDQGAATPPGDILVTVTVGSYSASKIVQVLDGDNPATFKNLSGTLAGANLTWSPADGVIHLVGDVTVSSGTLTIQPGTLVMVDSGPVNNGTAINAQSGGVVSALGTRAEPIFMFPTAGPAAMALPQTQQNNDSSWRGIYHQDSGTSNYAFVILSGAGNAVVASHPRPPILRCLNSHNLTMQDCVLADCPGMGTSALGGASGTYTFRRCLFSRVGIGGEWLGTGCTMTIEDSWFTRIGRAPEANGVDGDILHVDRPGNTYTIRRSILTDCGDDMIDHSTGAQPVVENCIIYDCRDKVVSIGPLVDGPSATITMTNCLMFNAPGGIRCNGAPAFLTNCTLGNNTNVNGQGCTGTILQKNIFWTNSAATCCGTVNYNIVGNAGNLGCGTGNLSVNPQFVSTSCNYSLQAGSPALTAGPGGSQIGWLGFPVPSGCINHSDCNDSNPCTTDTCTSGICSNTPIANCCQSPADCNDGDPCTVDGCSSNVCTHTPADCSDGNACTTDSCTTGVGCQHVAVSCDDSNACTIDSCDSVNGCQHAPVGCPPGQSCNPTNGQCEVGPTTVTFQNGVGGYTGTVDTYLQQQQPTTAHGSDVVVRWDTEESGAGTPIYALVRFDNIFGNLVGQIPAGSTITSATLTYVIGSEANATGDAGDLREATVAWTTSETYNGYGGDVGVQSDEYSASTLGSLSGTLGSHSVSVLSSLQAWSANPANNRGWIVLPTNTDGVQARSSDHATVADHPKLSVTFIPTATCANNGECNDNDACTTDVCNNSVCEHTPVTCNDNNPCTTDTCNSVSGCVFTPVANGTSCSDGNACNGAESCQGGNCTAGTPPNCDDGIACTTDSCNPGTGCVHTDSCPPGQTCNGGTGLCESGPVTVTFQQGVSGYTGTLDTYVDAGFPTTNNGAAVLLTTDGAPPATDERQILIRFDNIFGNGAGQIPAGSTISSATLTVNVSNAIAVTTNINVMKQTWSDSLTWTASGATPWNATPGIQADDVEAASATAAAPATIATGLQPITITSSVQAWSAAPATNFGWVLRSTAADSLAFDSSEVATAANRPKLTVTYVPPAGCTTNGQCDDGNPCTTDICNSGTCSHINNSNSCDDGNLCTTADVCSGGACAGTPVSCPPGQSCNGANGLCEAAPQTVSFQNGFSSYGGTVDTFIDSALGSQATATLIVIDGSPVEQALLRFDNIFGAGVGQIPSGSTISSATLTIWSGTGTNDGSPTPVTLHRLLHTWADTGVWADYGVAPWNAQAGIQNDGLDALAAQAGTTTITAAATSADIDVTTSLQAWASSPASNFGWAILPPPAGTDGLRLESAESTTSSNTRRPKLTVTYLPPGGCVNNGQCDDGNACTTDVCNAGVCEYAPVTCNDSNSCTTDSCNPTSGCVFTPVTDGTPCADADVCNGSETCQAGSCSAGTPLNCDDGIACTTDSCDSVNGCQHTNNCSPTVVAKGSRYLAITPPAGLPSVALRVESVALACMPMYVDATGHLTGTPVFRTSAAWGTVHVGDRAIVPSTLYSVRCDVRGPSDPENLSPSASATTWTWGDANGVDGVDVFDIVCVLDGFQSTFGGCTIYGDDLRGDIPDQGIDVFDIVAVLDAFQGMPYPDTLPCGSGLMMPPPAGSTPAVISLVPRSRSVSPGGVVLVDAFVSGAPTLRAYQLATDLRGGSGGALSVEAITFAADRPDNAFGAAEARSAIDVAHGRAANAMVQGWGDCSERHYLCTLALRASADSSGTFNIGLKSGSQTVLMTADRSSTAFSVTGAKVSVIRTANLGAGSIRAE